MRLKADPDAAAALMKPANETVLLSASYPSWSTA